MSSKKKVTKKKVTRKKVAKKKVSKRGAPTKLTKDLKKFLLHLFNEGKTDAEASKIVGIAESTLNKWKKEKPEFKESIKEAKVSTNEKVENALLKSAIGYEYQEERAMSVSLGQGLGSEVKMVTETKHKAGETRAQIYWLQNRDSERWKNMKAVEVTGADGGPLSVEAKLTGILDDIDGETDSLNG